MRTNAPSAPRRVLTSLSILLLAGPFVTACVGGPTLAPRIACGPLIPPVLRRRVEGVTPPPINATAGDIAVALDGQTGRLDIGNDYKDAAIAITDRCDAINADLGSRATAPAWQFWRR